MESGFFSSKTNQVLGSLVLAMIVAALASYVVLNLRMSKSSYTNPAIISVTGEGEASAIPNIGQFSFAVTASDATAEGAQAQSATKINDIMAYLKEQGVEEKDIKTENYNLNPKYRYEEKPCLFGTYCPPGAPISDGFEVSQSIAVKIRDVAKSGALIAGVGEKGATNISNLTFVVDDTEAVMAEARQKAVVDAKEKAEKLAKDLGVRIVRIAAFSENGGGYPMPFAEKMMSADAGGSTAPSVPVGENTSKVQVNITYEVQ